MAQPSSSDEIRVLVLDDEPDVGEVTCNAAFDFGYKPLFAHNSQSAREQIQKEAVHILILDIDLHESKNGVQLIPEFRALNADMVILMLTGEYDIKIAIQAMRAGAFDYILKPFDFGYLEQRLRQASERIRAQTLSKIYFNAIVHDLKNPIQNVALVYDFLKQMPYYQDNEKFRKVVHRGRQAVMDINKMVSNILSVEKLHVGEFQISKAAFHIQSAVEEALKIFEPVTPDETARVQLRFETPPELHAQNDKNVFQHVLFNLVSNAIRFSSSKTLVSVAVFQDKNSLKVSVTNQGSYIEEEDRTRIFEKFVQLDNKKNIAGMNFGLGLSFCKAAVLGMAGRVWIESNRDKNETVFWFTISL